MPKPEFQRIDLNEVVRSAVTLYQGAAPVETKLADQLPELDADKGQLDQVLLNLVENARDAIGKRAGGRITVTTRLGDAGDRALLVVEDNGPGVPARAQGQGVRAVLHDQAREGRHRASASRSCTASSPTTAAGS